MAQLIITYEDTDITREISPYVTAFTFTDNSGSNADDISLTLQDRNSLWLNDWTPSKSDKITPIIRDGDMSFKLGTFEVDEITYSIPPHTLSIKGVSCAVSKSSRHENHNKAWNDSALKDIASDIASSCGLELFYDAPDYQIERREQIHTPDLPFLEGICEPFGLSVKVSDDKLIIYSPEDYSSHEPVTVITPDDTRLISARFSTKSAGTFRKSRVRYHDPVRNEVYEAECEDEDEEGSEQELELYERVDSQSQAESVAKESLARANSKEITGSLTLTGNPGFVAGNTITLEGFGMFTGKYFIDKVTHTLSSGWTVSLSLKMGGESKKSVKKYKASSRKKAAQGVMNLADDTRGY